MKMRSILLALPVVFYGISAPAGTPQTITFPKIPDKLSTAPPFCAFRYGVQ